MKLIDEQYVKIPVCGRRSMRDHIDKQGHQVNWKRVQRITRLMGFEVIYLKPKTNKAHQGYREFLYLRKGMDINRADMVWAEERTLSLLTPNTSAM